MDIAFNTNGNLRSAGVSPANVATTLDAPTTDDIGAAEFQSEALGTTALNNAGVDGPVVYEATIAVAGASFTMQKGINAAMPALTAAHTANAVANTEMAFVLYDAEPRMNAVLFWYPEGGADGGVDANELALMRVVTNVGLVNLTDADFA